MAKMKNDDFENANQGLHWRRQRLRFIFALLATVSFGFSAPLMAAEAASGQKSATETVLGLRVDIETKFPKLLALMEKQTAAKLCGFYNIRTRSKFLSMKSQAIETEAADFDSQKVVRYVAMLQIETQIRELKPLELKSWCSTRRDEILPKISVEGS